jgi:hypothetical protein
MPASISGPRTPSLRFRSSAWLLLAGAALSGCASSPATPEAEAEAGLAAGADAAPATMPEVAPPPATQAWMDRLTIRHHYDPATGFIVADEVVPVPGVIRRAPDARTLVAFGAENDVPVIVFATADRCAPCQQFKRDALNDPEVIIALESGRIFATHVEVDQDPTTARELLGGGSIPVTYAFRDGRITDRLVGQRSAAELLEWLRAQTD